MHGNGSFQVVDAGPFLRDRQPHVLAQATRGATSCRSALQRLESGGALHPPPGPRRMALPCT
eukprot:10595862-Alexandrium_andersonii.AAC.1